MLLFLWNIFSKILDSIKMFHYSIIKRVEGEQAGLVAVHAGHDPGQAQVLLLLHGLGSLPIPR